MSNDIAAMMGEIAGAGDLTEYASGFDLGKEVVGPDGSPDPETWEKSKDGLHEVAINGFRVRKTREYGNIVEAEFVVLESNAHERGTIRGESWFIQKTGDEGKYSRMRLRACGKAVVAALGGDPADESEISKILTDLADAPKAEDWCFDGRGIRLVVTTEATVTKKNKKCIRNNSYAACAKIQTAEEIQALKGLIDAKKIFAPAKPSGAPPPEPVAGATAAAAEVPPPPKKSSLLKGKL